MTKHDRRFKIVDGAAFRGLWASDATREDIAAHFGVTPFAVSKACERITGKSILERRKMSLEDRLLFINALPAPDASAQTVSDGSDVSGPVASPNHFPDPVITEDDVASAIVFARASSSDGEPPRYWTASRDDALRQTHGIYAKIAELARRWKVPMCKLQARWHLLRGAR